MDKEIFEDLAPFLLWMTQLTEPERVEIFGAFRINFCLDCGRQTGMGETSHCENDE